MRPEEGWRNHSTELRDSDSTRQHDPFTAAHKIRLLQKGLQRVSNSQRLYRENNFIQNKSSVGTGGSWVRKPGSTWWSTCPRLGCPDPSWQELSRGAEPPAVRSCPGDAGRVPTPEDTRADAALRGSGSTWTPAQAPPRFGPSVGSLTRVSHAGAVQERPLTAPQGGTLYPQICAPEKWNELPTRRVRQKAATPQA